MFLNVAGSELLLPTWTFPKFKIVGLALSCVVADAALPVSASVCGEPGALSVKLMVPLVVPVSIGVNPTLNEML